MVRKIAAGSWTGILAAALAVLCGHAAAAATKRSRIYNWSDYIDREHSADFTKETGIKVIYDVFDSNEMLETKLLAGKTGYDIVVPTGSFLSRQIQAGVFQKLDKSKIPNIANLWPEVTEPAGSLRSRQRVRHQLHVGHDRHRLQRGQDQGADARCAGQLLDMIFKPEIAAKFKDCGIFVLDSPRGHPSARAQLSGLDPNTKNPEDLKKAEELIARSARTFASSIPRSTSTRWPMATSASRSAGRAISCRRRDRAEEAKNGHVIKYYIPKEGTQMWFDMMAIPKDAKNVDEAHIFLNYLQRPEVIAKASNYISYANGNLASQKFINEDILKNPAIYPDEATLTNLFVKPPTTRKHNER